MKQNFHTRSCLFILIAISATGSPIFGIKVAGTVRNAVGESVTHAFVEAIPIRSSVPGGTIGSQTSPWTPAHANGNFQLELPPGDYRIKAKDEIDGYPDPVYWLNADPTAVFPAVSVRDKAITDVRLILGHPGGTLEGQVSDSSSKKPISGATIRIQSAENSAAYVEVFTDASGKFRSAIPVKPLILTASAMGFHALSFRDGARVTVEPRGQLRADFDLSHE